MPRDDSTLNRWTRCVRSRSSARFRRPRAPRIAGALAVLAGLAACAGTGPPEPVASRRPFDFGRDTFAYTNNNYWIYDLDSDPEGTVVKRRRESVDHGQRCTIMSRAVRQFFYAARFDADEPRLAPDAYRPLIRKVVDTNPRRDRPLVPPIVIPGYADLREMSIDLEAILKEELGGRWIGYYQRGNWRMVFPFLPSQNRSTMRALIEDLERGHLPLVHVVNYPGIDINHTVMLFDFEETPLAVAFDLYDPNDAAKSGLLVFDRATRTFSYNRTDYFAGGPAQVYEIYDGLFF